MPKLNKEQRREYDTIINLWTAKCSNYWDECDKCLLRQKCEGTYDRLHNALDKLQGIKL